ncbi:hypothetical protein [Dethiosulfatarculus sandiegensis]|uniref:Uncharacterized protein n=1 Tax=Dethiosulfatarculus sandiegensis TaxID=1429043 RepID=A0A0D2K162_9BACT|nr:hypothetical protein [Dethiosulfatarculus sandiegensis]KIX15425.1 hypothetical protein X474_03740 [Dethiosulfatarculus sandiegensis]
MRFEKFSSAGWIMALAVLGVLCLSLPAQAVLPPKVYEQRALDSKIKAIAVVKSMQEVKRQRNCQQMKLVFTLEKAIAGTEAPQSFSGLCWVLLPGGRPMPGPKIYYRPQNGQRVFVSISEDGGQITTFTEMTPELEHALNQKPPAIKYGMGKVYMTK